MNGGRDAGSYRRGSNVLEDVEDGLEDVLDVVVGMLF